MITLPSGTLRLLSLSYCPTLWGASLQGKASPASCAASSAPCWEFTLQPVLHCNLLKMPLVTASFKITCLGDHSTTGINYRSPPARHSLGVPAITGWFLLTAVWWLTPPPTLNGAGFLVRAMLFRTALPLA